MAIERTDAISWNSEAIRAQAERFSVARFIEGMANAIRACLA